MKKDSAQKSDIQRRWFSRNKKRDYEFLQGDSFSFTYRPDVLKHDIIIEKDGLIIEKESAKVKKGILKRGYAPWRYYECHLENCLNSVDNEPAFTEKLEILDDILFDYKRDLKGWKGAPKLVKLIKVNITELETVQNRIVSMRDREKDRLNEEQQAQQHYKQKFGKGLKWHVNKNVIGTLFGLFLKEGIIEGSKADINRGLRAMFPDLKKDSLTDNINLKVNKSEAKKLYSIDVEKAFTPLLNELKKQKK